MGAKSNDSYLIDSKIFVILVVTLTVNAQLERTEMILGAIPSIMGWIVSPQNSCPPRTLFGNRVSADRVTLKWGHSGLGWALNLMAGVLIRRSCEDTEQKKTMWNGGRFWSDVATSHGTLRVVGQSPEDRPRQGKILLRALRGDMVLMTLWF